MNPFFFITRSSRFALLPLACAVAVVLAGCASVVPDGHATASMDALTPAAWSAASATPAASAGATSPTSLVQWWQRFNDAQLTALVTQAQAANTDIRKAQAALQQARALRTAAGAALLPTLGTSASAQRSTSNAGTANSFNAGLDASWEIDVFGANRSGVDASEATARASAASLGDVQVSVAAEVALNYITLRSTQARLAIAKDNLASQQDTAQITQWRQQAGLVTSLEVEQARATVAQTRAQLPALQTTLTQTHHALAVLTGQPPAALLAALATATPVPQAAIDLALSLPADTLRQRADVRAAELQVRASLARLTQADAARLPSFKLGGSLGLNALTLGGLTNGASVAASLLGSVSYALLDGGAARAQVLSQQAALDQTLMGYQATVLTALKDVEDALVALRGDRERLASLQVSADAAATAAGLARQRYSSGLVDFQTVLETQRSQLSAQDSLATAFATVSADQVRLYKALGGGWTPDSSNTTTTAPNL